MRKKINIFPLKKIWFGIFIAFLVFTFSGNTRSFELVHLGFNPPSQSVEVGEIVEVDITLFTDTPAAELMALMRAIIAWDPQKLQLLGNVDGDPDEEWSWWSSEFTIDDPYGINEVNPPADGDGLYKGIANPGDPIEVPASGFLSATTLQFLALEETSGTFISYLAEAGDPVGTTIIYSGVIPGLSITGDISAIASISIGTGEECTADIDGNGSVDIQDFLDLLAAWGPNPDHPADFNNDGDVDIQDFLDLLAAWGPCP